MNCNICEKPVIDKVYVSESEKSLTSLCTIYDGKTEVYFCQGCGHVQSVEIDNIDAYYDVDYDILVDSEEEDQIYEIVNDKTIYRTEHQLNTLRDKVELTSSTKILDYGCAKSSTMRALVSEVEEIHVHLFDVSDRYIPFWQTFVSEECWATYDVPDDWKGQFDVVTSFFSLEHMAQPQVALRQICRVLKEEGVVYGVVPNVFTNTADMIVVDHVNHFTGTSLQLMLEHNGFGNVEIDEQSHQGALVFKAKKEIRRPVQQIWPAQGEVKKVFDETNRVARNWQEIGSKIRVFESSMQSNDCLAIYGAGFYGAFIHSCLNYPERVISVVDQSPYLQGRKVNGVTVISPAELPSSINVLLVGLNPLHAKRLIENTSEFQNRHLTLFFL